MIGFIGAGLFSGQLSFYLKKTGHKIMKKYLFGKCYYQVNFFGKLNSVSKFVSVFIVIGFIGAGLFSGWLFYFQPLIKR